MNDPGNRIKLIRKPIQKRLKIRLWHQSCEQVTQVCQSPLFGYLYRAAGDNLPTAVVAYQNYVSSSMSNLVWKRS